MNDIDKKIRCLRKELGLTQKELGELAGLSQSLICSSEYGETKNLKKITQALLDYSLKKIDLINIKTDDLKNELKKKPS